MTQLIQQARDLFNITLTEDHLEQFKVITDTLIDWNQRMNLTTITDPDEIAIRHHLDSLSVAQNLTFAAGDKLADVGTGAGFPGLPLAVVFPQLQVTLFDSTRKKLGFVNQVIETLGLSNARTHHMRAETAGQDRAHREQYDVVVARAVALLPTLVEYLLPLAKVGGYCIAMKGESAEREVREAEHAIYVLGGEVVDIAPVHLPEVDRTHYLVVIEKINKTPRDYPRQPGMPSKEPIHLPLD